MTNETSEPTVFIIGDSISKNYTPSVRDLLKDTGITVDWFLGGDCAQLLAGLSEWIPGRSPRLIHLNCGLHDARFFLHSQAYQQPITNYQAHLGGITKWLQTNSTAKLIWASTTPVIRERISLHYVRREEDIVVYNDIAKRLMEAARIPINDLHQVVVSNSTLDCVCEDGVHMTEFGNRVLAQAVAGAVNAQLDGVLL